MKKIAFIITRYGREVAGGAEVHCRMLAERLCPWYEVEVLTTTIRVFGDPAKDYPRGVAQCNGVTVRRFAPAPFDNTRYKALSKRSKTARRLRCRLRQAGLLRPIMRLLGSWSLGAEDERRMLEAEQTHSPELLRFIAEHRDEYGALIFLNCYTSASTFGAQIAPEKSLLIPLAHANKELHRALFVPLFSRVRHIAFNTEAERRLCRSIFGRAMAEHSTVGCGIEETPPAPWEEVKAKYGLPDDYVLYLGRINPLKICDVVPNFLRYKQRYRGGVELVLVGGAEQKIDFGGMSDIVYTGFVSDAEKSAILRHAAVIVNPSSLESLSLLMLEALENRIPLLVNGRCRVMKDHCTLSGAALWYDNDRDFVRKLHRLLSDRAASRRMAEKGPAYVHSNYDWEVILTKIRRIIDGF